MTARCRWSTTARYEPQGAAADAATRQTALVVGTVLFAINQLDVVLSGAATASTWVKAAVTYVVPFAVANIGVLVGCRRSGEPIDPPVGQGPSASSAAVG